MNRLVVMLGAGIAALALSGGAWAASHEVVTAAQIEAAKTPADHESIAAAYEQEAARLESKAAEHGAMADAYTNAGSKKGMNTAAMHAHCAKLAKQYGEAAKENRALAAEHRKMAQAAAH